jgi:alcohol dehydrogenase
MDFEFHTVPSIVCQVGSAGRLDAILEKQEWLGAVLIVTDPGVRRAGLVDPSVSCLTAAGRRVAVFDDVVADPPESTVLAAVEFARGFNPDIIIGIGGGSAMDTAKIVAVLLGTDQPLDLMYGVGAVQGRRKIPLILIPTTAGTGSEVTPIAIVTTGATVKKGIVAPQLLPDMAILDAALTTGLPRTVTAHTGIDAMVHAIEAYTSRHKKNPLSDALARRALTLLWDNLVPVLSDGNDMTARENMLLGACLAGQAFANAPVGAVHALAYPIGGIYHVTHGLSNALVLPHVLRFNLAAARTHYRELAHVVNAGTTAESFIEAIEGKCVASGIERRLRDVKIPHNALGDLAQSAMLQTRLLANNPRDMSLSYAQLIYEQAW